MSDRIEYCFACGDPTGHAGYGDDSIGFVDGMIGPLCDKCYGQLRLEIECECSRCQKNEAELARLRRGIEAARKRADDYERRANRSSIARMSKHINHAEMIREVLKIIKETP